MSANYDEGPYKNWTAVNFPSADIIAYCVVTMDLGNASPSLQNVDIGAGPIFLTGVHFAPVGSDYIGSGVIFSNNYADQTNAPVYRTNYPVGVVVQDAAKNAGEDFNIRIDFTGTVTQVAFDGMGANNIDMRVECFDEDDTLLHTTIETMAGTGTFVPVITPEP